MDEKNWDCSCAIGFASDGASGEGKEPERSCAKKAKRRCQKKQTKQGH